MAKERIVEQFGQIRYTIGTGCSGGSLTQQQVANAYPGVYQGILPQCSYPDALSTGIQFADYHGFAPTSRTSRRGCRSSGCPLQWGPVEGHLSGSNAVSPTRRSSRRRPPPAGLRPGRRRLPPRDEPGRGALLDPRLHDQHLRAAPEDVWSPMEQAAGKGFAGFPLGNVGVQYGLGALESGLITTEQFVDLNHEIGGLDIDINHVPERTAGDLQTLKQHLPERRDQRGQQHGPGRDHRHARPRPGDRARRVSLVGAARAPGSRARHHENQVIWFGPTPLLGDAQLPDRGADRMDEWLSAVEDDKSSKPLAEKIIANKPGDLQDECEPTGLIVGGGLRARSPGRTATARRAPSPATRSRPTTPNAS